MFFFNKKSITTSNFSWKKIIDRFFEKKTCLLLPPLQAWVPVELKHQSRSDLRRWWDTHLGDTQEAPFLIITGFAPWPYIVVRGVSHGTLHSDIGRLGPFQSRISLETAWKWNVIVTYAFSFKKRSCRAVRTVMGSDFRCSRKVSKNNLRNKKRRKYCNESSSKELYSLIRLMVQKTQTATWHVWNPVNTGISTISTG